MEKNKTGKYLKYAIGEIVLVVIGILIALQINNWNELNKLEDKKQVYLDQLLIDIAKDTTSINRTIDGLQKSIKTYDTYVESYIEPNMEVDIVLSNLIKVDYTYPIIIFNTNTIITLLETGDIKLMPTDIRDNILDIMRLQQILENQRDQLDPEYMRLLNDASKLGMSSIYFRLTNQSKLSDILNIKENKAEIILTFEAAFGLKKIESEVLKNCYQNTEI